LGAIPQPTEWQRISNQINAPMILRGGLRKRVSLSRLSHNAGAFLPLYNATVASVAFYGAIQFQGG